jgi:uncharacterized membrane protein
MTHTHVHSRAAEGGEVTVGWWPKVVVLVALLSVAAGLTCGLVALWPSSHALGELQDRAVFAAPGVTFPNGVVTKVQPVCPPALDPAPGELPPEGYGEDQNKDCGNLSVHVATGKGEGRTVTFPVAPDVSSSGLRGGDRVELARTPDAPGQPPTFSYWTTKRTTPLGWLAVAFAVVVVLVARLRGLLAIIGLGLSALMLTKFMLPALLTGEPGIWVAVSGSAAIMYVVLYSTHGISWRTSAALVGTLAGIAMTASIGWYAVGAARLTGVTDESGGVLASMVGDVDFQQLLMCGVVVGGLGVLNDVTITQSSAVWELRRAAPERNRRSIFAAAMRIGRDHIASTIYTIFFAYAGSAIIVLLLLSLYDRPLLDLLSAEELAEEVARTLASGIGLVLAVPLTTAIAAMVASPRPPGPAGAQEPGPVADPQHPVDSAPDGNESAFESFWSRN